MGNKNSRRHAIVDKAGKIVTHFESVLMLLAEIDAIAKDDSPYISEKMPAVVMLVTECRDLLDTWKSRL